ncbi:uncharacterized protein BDZ99DRAFT_433386 [Mytilinidion resinicola]|uniref:P-loop containing nucleoside triphosphate hydrolase protein n=1 Tax=Mytilinidion resinicola TaxID=574789 RepID=A0A6A6Z5C0_9PEZI|nr:uncharacterized protein BDZ99DRAFT_433386 [Mytilinidion resinicola]KAF2816286.1 hypothetical protein BDZ99DRAFT_433386 [Mytilinidion resinicola]
MKAQSAENARLNKRKADQRREQEEEETMSSPTDEDSLFVGESTRTDDDERIEGSSAGQRRQASIPRKTPKPDRLKGSMESMLVGYKAFEDDGKKKKRQMLEAQAAALSKGKGRGKGKAKATSNTSNAKKGKGAAKAGGKVAKKAKSAKYVGPNMTDVGSLFTSNVFKDQEGNEDRSDQPTFEKGRKDQALKQLIASVPLEHQKSARADRKVLLAATKDFTGHGSCKPDNDGKWLVKGMKTSLKSYQLLGSAFMRRRETAVDEPRGGLIADQMGLGKTVMMLANIINGKAPKDKKDGRATLIVASPALVEQWKEEIKVHCQPWATGAVMTWRAGNRLDSTEALSIMDSHDIILTTYTDVMKSYPKTEPPIEILDPEDKQAWWVNEWEEKRGPLHRMRFLRVVLDEAQAIKNHTGRTSIACRGLMADHKWALSGTPVMNGITELYPYFKFLNVPHTGSFKIFKANYCNKSDPDTTQRLLVRLNAFMIRRTHKDIMFGAPILKLPKATPITHWCEFNDVERSVYDIVRKRFIARINSFASAGQLEKSYTNIFVMLLRLRQLTGHILTLQLTMQDLLEMEDIERLKQLTQSEEVGETDRGRQIVSIRTQLTAMIKEIREADKNKGAPRGSPAESSVQRGPSSDADLADKEDEDEDDEMDEVSSGDAIINTGGGFGMKYEFKPYLDTLTSGKRWEAIKEKAKCAKCHETPIDPWLTACSHIYCQLCLEDLQLEAATTGRDRAVCSHCAQMFSYSVPCEDDHPDGSSRGSSLDFSGDEGESSTRHRARRSRKSKDVRPERETIPDDWIDMSGNAVLPSAKTLAIKAQVLNWLHEAPNTKIIIYTQFLAIIRILSKICQEEQWNYCEYHGSMSLTARSNTIKTFAEDHSRKILLASLKCGGLGLNLTMASRVIVVDPWWNHAIEQQAFCRVFRYGQESKTYMTRFCVRNTVDEKLINMQERKTAEIDEVMEDDGKTMKKLGMRDLLRLFGPVREAEDGTPFILVDDPQNNGCVDPEYEDEDL